jgi:hypothetical protein
MAPLRHPGRKNNNVRAIRSERTLVWIMIQSRCTLKILALRSYNHLRLYIIYAIYTSPLVISAPMHTRVVARSEPSYASYAPCLDACMNALNISGP